MSILEYKRQRNAMEVQPIGNHSPFREVLEQLEQLFDMVVRLDREVSRGVSRGGSYDLRVG